MVPTGAPGVPASKRWVGASVTHSRQLAMLLAIQVIHLDYVW